MLEPSANVHTSHYLPWMVQALRKMPLFLTLWLLPALRGFVELDAEILQTLEQVRADKANGTEPAVLKDSVAGGSVPLPTHF